MGINKKFYVLIAVCVLLLVGMITVVWLGVGHHSSADDVSEQTMNDVLDSFSSYTYTEQYSDGSKVDVVIYPCDNGYAALLKYFDKNGAADFSSYVLSEKNVERFEESLLNFTLSESLDNDDTTMSTKALVVLETDTGSSSYDVSPFDISGFGILDEWTSSDVETVVSSPKFADVFSEDVLEQILKPASATELYAYMNMIHEDIAEKVETSDFTNVVMEGDLSMNGMYKVSVMNGDEEIGTFRMSEYGYIADTANK